MNPSFPVTVEAAKADLRRMMAAPRPLVRPLVILDGYMDPFIAPTYLRRVIGRMTGDKRILPLCFLLNNRFAACRQKVIAAVDERFPVAEGVEGGWTSAVDVIGFSMGGLIARDAARAGEGGATSRRLRIARLFTISTPHRGAAMARLPALTSLQRDMRFGSSFLADLAAAYEGDAYPIYPYVRLRDWIVGEARAAPAGTRAWWVPRRTAEPSHLLAFRDPRIVADIARRLRGEPALTHPTPAPLPG